MANQTIEPQPGDVADEKGRFAPEGLPGDPPMAPDTGTDASASRQTPAAASARPVGTQGAAIEDLADPDADANAPDPSRPIATGAGR